MSKPCSEAIRESAGSRAPGHRHRCGLRPVLGHAAIHRCRLGELFRARLTEASQHLADEPAHGRESVLGAGSHQIDGGETFEQSSLPRPQTYCRTLARRSARHYAKTARCAARSAGTARQLLATAKACSRIATPAGWSTVDYGTALALFFAAHESGKRLHVYVDETRPLLQGSHGSPPGNCSGMAST